MKAERFERHISHTTIYRLLEKDRIAGGQLYQLLPRFGKTRWKGGKRKAGRSLIPDRKDISERPAIVDRRGRRGDWEGDTVHGQDAHLVTLVDRKSRLTLIGKVPDKKAATVAKEMIRLMKRVPGSRTITLDNGGEFAQHGKVSKKCGVNVYFAKPYASYQRGTNENTNGIIRRHWPKKMAMGALTEQDIREMELILNTTPRKVLGGKTPIEVYTKKSIALVA